LVISEPHLDVENGFPRAALQRTDTRAHQRQPLLLRFARVRITPMLQGVSIATRRAYPWMPDILRPQHLDR
jgi:hypothetical protein